MSETSKWINKLKYTKKRHEKKIEFVDILWKW